MRLRISLLMLLLLLASCAPATPAAEGPRIPLHDCTLSAPGVSPVKARCGALEVAEDPARPDGRKISLNVAVVPAVSRSAAPDPIFLLAGGPGEAATKAFLPLLPAAEKLRFKRDLVMVDQRGTGASHPLECHDPTPAPGARHSSGDVIGVEKPVEEQVAVLAACRAALDADPAMYGTETAMGDLDQVRSALGYQQINLLGVSYGTRAALTYLRLYPEHARSLVLDGVVPPGWALGEAVAPDARRSLEATFARCAQDTSCAAAFPNLPETFAALMAKLDQQTVDVTVPDPRTAAPVRVQLNPRTAGAALRLMSYSDVFTALIPLAVHSAGQGDYQMLASQYLMLIGSLDESLGMGMYFSVFCAEDQPLLAEAASTGADDPYRYLELDLDALRAGCSTWRAGAAAPPALETGGLKADTPTLLISGELDPVTPPANAEQVRELLPNSASLVAPGMGHSNFYTGCIPGLVLDFLDRASPQGLDTTCLSTIQPMPFFLSPAGPKP